MLELSIEKIRSHLVYAGESPAGGYDFDELRWRMYQWRKLGLMYFSQGLDRLAEEGKIDACFVAGLPEARFDSGQFVPEPFPVLAEVYDYLEVTHRWDRVTFLSELAYLKLAHEAQRADVDFSTSEEYSRYCSFIDRFYESSRPYKGKKVYWVLFDECGVDFFSDTFDLDADRLKKFMVKIS